MNTSYPRDPRYRAKTRWLHPNALLKLLVAASVMVGSAWATLVPKMTLEQMIDDADLVVHGTIVRTWTDWDASRQFIWTHYELQPLDLLKGAPQAKVVVSEPGGTVDEMSMQIAGSPRYEVGDEVVVFADRTPIGYLRTCGWGQGKFNVLEVEGAKVVRAPRLGVQLVEPTPGSRTVEKRTARPTTDLNGLELNECKRRLRSMIQAQSTKEGR